MLLVGSNEVERYIKEQGIRYFKLEEFLCRCGCGGVVIDSKVLDTLEKLRERLKKPVVINSAYRCIKHNRAIGGVPGSAHIRGYAVDIKALHSATRHKIVEFLLQKGIQRIGVASNFVHFDVDPDKPKPALWTYDRAKHVA
ncbi:MAG: peptidase M15 [Thermotogae bacterium]|nr:peptidase M15 [Thermotogota bacterium]